MNKITTVIAGLAIVSLVGLVVSPVEDAEAKKCGRTSLTPLPEEMNTLDKFMRQMMSELRSFSTKNISVNKTSTIGVDDIPAYRVELEYVSELGTNLHTKSIDYFSIDNSTGTGYMISFTTVMEKLQEDAPLFVRMVESFKILS
jgi:hypothetical protein